MNAPTGSSRDEVAQKACLLEGLTQLLAVTPGDFAVVLHSDPDCANLVWRDFRAVDPTRFFCTNLTENEVISGSTRPVLEEAIRHVAARGRASTIFVIGSCVSSLLAEDIRDVTDQLSGEVSPGLVGVHTEAFRLYGQAHILDRYTHAMWSMARGTGRRGERSVNLLGFPPARLWADPLARMGVTVNAAPTVGDPPGVWGSLGTAAVNVTTDRRLFSRIADEMESDLGIPCVEVAPPYGVQATRTVHEVVARQLGLGPEVMKSVADASAPADVALQEASSLLRGTRLGYHLAGRKDFSLDVVVREGLSVVGMFMELGMDVHLLMQGSTEGRAGERVQRMLAGYGLDLPLRSVPDRVSVTRAIEELRLDAIHCSASLHEEVSRAGVPLIPLGSMQPGFQGLVHNAARLMELRTRSEEDR